MSWTSLERGALELYVGPIGAQLAHKRAELAVLRRLLADREAELGTFEGVLSDFELRYRRALGQRYAVLDDLAEQIEQVKPGGAPKAGGQAASNGGRPSRGAGTLRG
jgi:hypothetical protein